jgi:hypothetical protein
LRGGKQTAARQEVDAMAQCYTYRDVLAASERITWQVEDLIGPGKSLNFDMAFVPESLARVDELKFLAPCERRVLNQIRGHSYLSMFIVVEGFILPFVMNHSREHLQADDYRAQALLQFASEEAKHIHLFNCFREAFEDGFGIYCDVIGPGEDIAETVLAHHPLAVALAALHIEWMTQRHYVESIKDNQSLDPLFRNLLRHHWMEEAQHAKLDTLMIEAMAAQCEADEIDEVIDDYLKIAIYLGEALGQQVDLDLDSFTRATGRQLTDEESAEFCRVQHQANRWTYIGSGMTHRNFLTTVEGLRPLARNRVEQAAQAYC